MIFIEILIVALLVIIDQGVKIEIIKKLSVIGNVEIIPNFFYLRYAKNTGVAFSMFSGKVILMGIIGIIAIIGICYFYVKNRKKTDLLMKSALILTLAGAIGNTIDRFYRGYVVDFIDFSGIWNAIFNVADTYLTIGVGLLIIHMLLEKKKENIN